MKTTLEGRQPWKEDDLRRKTTLQEDDLGRKTILEGRIPWKDDNLSILKAEYLSITGQILSFGD